MIRAPQLQTLLYVVSCPLSYNWRIMLDRRKVRLKHVHELVSYGIKHRSDRSLASIQDKKHSLQVHNNIEIAGNWSQLQYQ